MKKIIKIKDKNQLINIVKKIQKWKDKYKYDILSRLNLENVDFTDIDLSGLDFTNLNLSKSKFNNNNNLSKVVFYKTNLKNIDFTNIDLTNVKFNFCNLKNCRFPSKDKLNSNNFFGNIVGRKNKQKIKY